MNLDGFVNGLIAPIIADLVIGVLLTPILDYIPTVSLIVGLDALILFAISKEVFS